MRSWLATALAIGIAVPAFAQEGGEMPPGAPEGGGDAGIGHAGTNEIGGSAFLVLENASDGGSASGFQLSLNPAYGRFFTDNFLFRFGLVVTAFAGDLFSGAPKTFGFQFEPLYVAPAGNSNLFFYVGGLLAFTVIAPDQGDNLTSIGFGGAGGVLVPLNSWVALDAGMQIEFAISSPGSIKELIVPVGLLGVRGYFD
jgi:hypothetical protein